MSGPLLLVSVREPDEVAAAVAGGAAIIDVKDPGRGSLGRATAATLAACAAVVPRQLPWTFAAGELRDWASGDENVFSSLPERVAPPTAVKFGLARSSGTDWSESLAQIGRRVPAATAVVPVAYADPTPAAAPPVAEVIDLAARGGFPLVLVDTFDKQAGSLLDLVTETELRAWVARARAAGLGLLLAGRLGLEQIPIVAGCQPDAVAVRSAACIGGRLGRIDRSRVATAAEYCRCASGSAAACTRPLPLRSVFQQGVDE